MKLAILFCNLKGENKMKRSSFIKIIAMALVLCMLFTSCDLFNKPEPDPQPAACQHTKTELKNAVPATCTETGLTEGSHCSVCETVIKAQKTTSAQGHSYGDWIMDPAPTKTEDGKRYKKCINCPDTIEEILYATGSLGLEYTLSHDGSYYILSNFGTCTDTEVIIPLMYNGKPVTAIGNAAFLNCSTLQTITIPSYITSFGGGVFCGCISLKSVKFENKITEFSSYAFAGNQYGYSLYYGMFEG